MLEDLIPQQVGAVRGPLAPTPRPTISWLDPKVNPFLADKAQPPQPAPPTPPAAPPVSPKAQQRTEWRTFRDATVAKLVQAGVEQDYAENLAAYQWAKRSHDESA
jgi:hypothetical protein